MPIKSEWEHHAKCGRLNFIGDQGEICNLGKLQICA